MKFDPITDSLGAVSRAALPAEAMARPCDKGTRSPLGRWLWYLNPFRRTARIEARVAELESAANRSAAAVAVALQSIQDGFEAELHDCRQKASEQIRSVEARVAEFESAAKSNVDAVTLALQSIQDAFEAELHDCRDEASGQIRSVEASADRALASAAELTQVVRAMPLMIEERFRVLEQSSKSLPQEQEASLLAWIEERAAIAEACSKAFAEQRFRSVLRLAEERANIVEAQLLARMTSAFDLVWNRLREHAELQHHGALRIEQQAVLNEELASLNYLLKQELLRELELRSEELVRLNDHLKQELFRELELRSMVAESGAKAYADSGLGALAASIGASNRAMLRIAGHLDKVRSGERPDHAANEDAINGKLGVK